MTIEIVVNCNLRSLICDFVTKQRKSFIRLTLSDEMTGLIKLNFTLIVTAERFHVFGSKNIWSKDIIPKDI
jgi:hypothetical protein